MKRRFLKRIVLPGIAFGIIFISLFFIFIAPDRTVPILMYHSISNAKQGNNTPILPKYIFKRHMQYLSDHNYYVASLEEVVEALNAGKHIPHNWVVLTFDDNYEDFYSQTYPILKQYRFKATISVIVNCLDKRGALSFEQLEELAKDNLIDIGSHSLLHRLLPLLSPSEYKKEILLSKQILERRFRKPISCFAYPEGALNLAIKDKVKEAGYKVGVGIVYPEGQFRNNDIFILKRVFVDNLSRVPLVFRFMLSGYYCPTKELILRILNIKTPRSLYGKKLNFSARRWTPKKQTMEDIAQAIVKLE